MMQVLIEEASNEAQRDAKTQDDYRRAFDSIWTRKQNEVREAGRAVEDWWTTRFGGKATVRASRPQLFKDPGPA